MLWLRLVLMYAFAIPIFSSIGYFLISALTVIFLTGKRSLIRIAIDGVTLIALLGVIAVTVDLPNNIFLTQQFATDLRELNPIARWIWNLVAIMLSLIFLLIIRGKWIRAGKEVYRN